MPPPPGKGKAKAKGAGKGGKGLARPGGQSEDHSFDEVVSEHSKNLEELRERQKVNINSPLSRLLGVCFL